MSGRKGIGRLEGHQQWPHWVLKVVLGMGAELPFLGGRIVGVWLSAQICHVGFRWQGGMKAEEAHCSLNVGKGNMKIILFTCSLCLDLSFFSFCVYSIDMNYFLAFSYL